jgi:hypothetical protein
VNKINNFLHFSISFPIKVYCIFKNYKFATNYHYIIFYSFIIDFRIVKPKALTGAFEINNHLDNAERIFEGELTGPEHLLPAGGNSFYASLHNGNVVKIDGKHITFVAKFGKPCEYPVEESICGRPLGLAHDTLNPDQLIVADAYYGIWELNVKSGQKKQLVSPGIHFGVNVRFLLHLNL